MNPGASQCDPSEPRVWGEHEVEVGEWESGRGLSLVMLVLRFVCFLLFSCVCLFFVCFSVFVEVGLLSGILKLLVMLNVD